jgi:multidrug efflux pump
LLAQFNKLTSVALVLFSIILSTIGVFIGLMIMGQAFGIIMTGIGIIALAGIVTNNNIVLIDTYDRLRREGVPVEEAILRTCRERARPVLLTATAAVLGVLPIAFGLNVNFVHQEILFGAPSTQWWIQLSTAIVFGLGFATILTLIVTPSQLAFVAKMSVWFSKARARFRRKPAPTMAGAGAPAHARSNEDQTHF